jgi:hypothetical protein
MNDQIDIERFRISPEGTVRLEEAVKKRREADQLKRVAAKPGAIAILPYDARMYAAAARRDASMAVLVELAYLAFQKHSGTVLLSNGRLGEMGVSRYAKARALRLLAADGLVTVDWRGKKTPRVTILWEVRRAVA